MSSNTFSGLKSSMNAKQNTINSSTAVVIDNLLSIDRIYANQYRNPGNNIAIYSYTNNSRNYVTIQSYDSQPLVINPDGGSFTVGGTASEQYKFGVTGTLASSSAINYRYFTYNNYTPLLNASGFVITNVAVTSIIAKFNSTMMVSGSGAGIYMSSDERIKTNIQDIDDDNALQLIMKVEPKTYEYIDKIERSDKRVYGFIAQQIQEVIPEAVTTQPSVIPNIFKTGILTDSNVITMDTDISDTIKIDSNISLITSNLGKKEYKVINVNSNQFTIDTNIDDSNNVFVYGTKVNDFHILDKNYIFTLNVCATQELYKLIQLNQSNINQLNEGYENMSNNINLIKNKINSIK